jgi:hypothetical protein
VLSHLKKRSPFGFDWLSPMALIKPDFCHNDCEVWLELDESLSIAEICKLEALR